MQPISRPVVSDLLARASRAASGTNTQPWEIVMLEQQRANALVDAVIAAAPSLFALPETAVFANTGSVRPVGAADAGTPPDADARATMLAQFQALRAPLAAICVIDTRLGRGSELDDGMFLQNLRLLAASRGIGVRLLPAWQVTTPVARPLLELGETKRVLCGVAIGVDDARIDGAAPDVVWL